MIKSLRKIGLPLIFACTFILGACSEELITQKKGDPKPDITDNEENQSADDIIESRSLIVPQYSTTDGRVPLPNDLILSSVNDSIILGGGDALNGMAPTMPIRIPFNKSIDVPDFDYSGTPGQNEAADWAKHILILPLGKSDAAADDSSVENDPRGPFLPLPVLDRNGNPLSPTRSTGYFKAVYQDDNHDLILLPNSDTFLSGHKYAVIVKKSLNSKLVQDTLFATLMSDLPLLEGDVVTHPILVAQNTSPKTTRGLESLRLAYESILKNIGIAKNDVAVMHTFTTSYSTATEVALSATAVSTMQATAGDTTRAATNSVEWLSDNGLTTTVSLARDFREFFSGKELPVGNLSKILYGSYNCNNFLAYQSATQSWDLDLANRAATPGTDCPNADPDIADGKISFYLAVPATTITPVATGVVLFQHGITRNNLDFAAIANTYAGAGYATIAIDIWNHGVRTYEDGDGDGTLEASLTTGFDDSGRTFIRPDNPALTTGYIIQTLMDMTQLSIMIKTNAALLAPLGIDPTATLGELLAMRTAVANNQANFGENAEGLSKLAGLKILHDADPPLFVTGQSLGGNFSVSLGSGGTVVTSEMVNGTSSIFTLAGLSHTLNEGEKLNSIPFKRMVASAPGGDLADIVINGPTFGPTIKAGVAASRGFANPSSDLNSTMIGVELSVLHALFAGNADSLSGANQVFPTSILMQEIINDQTFPNSNTELLSISMGLTKKNDGDSPTTGGGRVQWVLNPDNYPNGTAGHGFLLDGATTATQKGQLQALCYLRTGSILDPSKAINSATCTQ